MTTLEQLTQIAATPEKAGFEDQEGLLRRFRLDVPALGIINRSIILSFADQKGLEHLRNRKITIRKINGPSSNKQ